jgi:putative 2OG-Fe(II) oxygenase
MNMQRVLQAYKKNGFANAGPQALTCAEVDELASLLNQAFTAVRDASAAGEKHPDYLAPSSGVEGVMRIPQQHPRIAQLLDKIVSDGKVRAVLDDVLGPDYKIWQANFRRSIPGDKGLYLHQDGRGETNLCILLSSNPFGAGATVFLPGSHLVKTRMKQWRIEAPPILLRWMSFLFTPLTGVSGDIAFFLNRTWHGRAHNPSTQAFDVILISFFPAGATFGFKGYGDWSPEFLTSLQGTRLGALINPTMGTQQLSDGLYEILPSGKVSSQESPFALAIDDGQISRAGAGGLNLILTIAILRSVFAVGRPLWHLVRGFVPQGKR